MALNVLWLAGFFVATLAFVWLARRAWRAKRGLIKWPGLLLSGLLTLLLAALTVVIVIGMFKAYLPRGNAVASITVERTPERIARGQHIASVVCASCHSLTLSPPLSGGKNLSEDAGMPLGVLVPANLTPAGRINDWTDGEVRRAFREGTSADGHLLPVMASQTFGRLGEEDVQSLIAFLRSQAPVQNTTPRESLSVLSVAFLALGMLPQQPLPPAVAPTAPPRGPTAPYGEYIAGYLDCAACHGSDLHGGTNFLFPKGPGLGVAKGWTQAQFTSTMRTGVDPGGLALDPAKMPWDSYRNLADDELAALHAYLISVP